MDEKSEAGHSGLGQTVSACFLICVCSSVRTGSLARRSGLICSKACIYLISEEKLGCRIGCPERGPQQNVKPQPIERTGRGEGIRTLASWSRTKCLAPAHPSSK